MSRSAILVAVPEAEAAVAEHRLVHDPVAAVGVPAHITVLFPFVPPAELEVSSLDGLFGAHEPFTFTLSAVRRFDGGPLYLEPDDPAPWLRLTETVVARFPAYLPYEGAHDAVIPHVTVAQRPSEDDATRIGAVLGRALPIPCRADRALLMEQGRDACWRTRAVLPFGGAP